MVDIIKIKLCFHLHNKYFSKIFVISVLAFNCNNSFSILNPSLYFINYFVENSFLHFVKYFFFCHIFFFRSNISINIKKVFISCNYIRSSIIDLISNLIISIMLSSKIDEIPILYQGLIDVIE